MTSGLYPIKSGTVVRKRVSSPQGNYEATVHNIRDLVLEVESKAGGTGSVGVAIPGTISPASGLIKNANSTWLAGKALDKDLGTVLNRPVRLANDANCFALSEAVDGAAVGANVVFGVIIGTGVGGGIVVGQRVLTGPNSIAGEWGHNPMPWPGENEWPGVTCYCGKQACIETFVSGTGMARDHLLVTGEAIPAEEIIRRAEDDDQVSSATLARYERRLGKSLASILNVLDPDIIVLGGGVSNVQRLYKNIPPLIAEYSFSDEISTPVVQNLHGDSSGVRGAAWLW
ncbi:MAG: ROK family protein [Alphaproteobacteria bacterium]|nr:ROK family protein [Alphaproteobacteria bacterium]MBT4019875.1 ROK family protein [Alphaproteobacteria bacterium]MBT4965761.1 ROK family protein [Alphaproteobacteria bacterium]MBT7747397.1 ROK family protein [Alphaproteobacteria bacterium]